MNVKLYLSLSLDREKTVKRSKHAVVVWLTAALVPSLPRPSAKRTQNEIKKKDKRYFEGTNLQKRRTGCMKWQSFWRESSIPYYLWRQRDYLKPLDSIYIAFSTCHRQLLWNCAPFDQASTLDFIKQAFCCIRTHGEREQLVWLFICFWGVVWVQLEVDANTIKQYCIYFMCLSVSSATRSKQHDRNIDSFICMFFNNHFQSPDISPRCIWMYDM